MKLHSLQKELKIYFSKEKAEFFPRFFKTGKGEYAEGDKFIGVTVPNCRLIAKKYKDINLTEIGILLKSKIHEERLVALLILVEQFRKGDDKLKEKIFNFYLTNSKNINNWDLVDLSAPKIVGEYLITNQDCATTFKDQVFKGTYILNLLANSESLWQRRIAIISTYAFIRIGELNLTLTIAVQLLSDKHDLIHKAVGWMLREVGKKDQNLLEKFLKDNYSNIPRTTLRYSIEKYPEMKRKIFLNGKF